MYDYDKMVAWLMEQEGWSADEAMEWIEFNTIGALPSAGEAGPIVMYGL